MNNLNKNNDKINPLQDKYINRKKNIIYEEIKPINEKNEKNTKNEKDSKSKDNDASFFKDAFQDYRDKLFRLGFGLIIIINVF